MASERAMPFGATAVSRQPGERSARRGITAMLAGGGCARSRRYGTGVDTSLRSDSLRGGSLLCLPRLPRGSNGRPRSMAVTSATLSRNSSTSPTCTSPRRPFRPPRFHVPGYRKDSRWRGQFPVPTQPLFQNWIFGAQPDSRRSESGKRAAAPCRRAAHRVADQRCTTPDLEWVPASSRQALPGALKPTLGAPLRWAVRIGSEVSQAGSIWSNVLQRCTAPRTRRRFCRQSFGSDIPDGVMIWRRPVGLVRMNR